MNKKMFICGKWVAKKDRVFVKDPFSGKIVGTVPQADINDVTKAVDFLEHAKIKLSAFERSKILANVASKMLKIKNSLALLITKESGKTIKDSLLELKRAYETLIIASEEAKKINGETLPTDIASGWPKKIAFTIKEPIGLILAITPFNYPINLVVHKIAPAIAAGNKVILKPSEKTPLSSLVLMELLIECGFPKEMLAVITGSPEIIGPALITHPAINMINFTGSIETGKEIMRYCGLKKVLLELGGNDPFIVLSDADIEKAAAIAVVGAFNNNGQRCTSIKRIIVEDAIADDFIKKFVSKTKKLKTGDPKSILTDIGPLITEEAAVEIERLVNDAVDKGAKILCGGRRQKAFYYPTILDEVSPNAQLVAKETFGPIAPIIRVKDANEALRIANATEYGLQAGVMTKDINKIHYFIDNLEAGSVMINEGPNFRLEHLPFGGIKKSGIGKEGVRYSIEEMTQTKTIVL